MFHYVPPTRAGPDGSPPVHGRAARLVDAALEWLDDVRAASDRPFLIVFLTIEPHDGYEPAEPFRSRLAGDVTDRDIGTVEFMRQLRYRERASSPELIRSLFRLYDAEIAWNDHEFGRFQQEILERELDPVIVVTADHGEQFGEHGHFGHLDLHQETLHIPFTVRVPGQSVSRRVDVPVQQADLFPTLIDLAGGEASGFDGQSLVPLLLGREPDEQGFRSRPIVSESRKGTHTSLDLGPYYSLVLDRWKLIWKDRHRRSSVQLFDRVNDPAELVDLAGENPMLARRLLRALQDEIEIIESRGGPEAIAVTIDDETRRQLEALGYVD